MQDRPVPIGLDPVAVVVLMLEPPPQRVDDGSLLSVHLVGLEEVLLEQRHLSFHNIHLLGLLRQQGLSDGRPAPEHLDLVADVFLGKILPNAA